eukprot:6348726-Alexandrium_andersonii.AAC.1
MEAASRGEAARRMPGEDARHVDVAHGEGDQGDARPREWEGRGQVPQAREWVGGLACPRHGVCTGVGVQLKHAGLEHARERWPG